MRGASALIAADHLNRFSNGSPSVIHVAQDWHVFWPDLDLALASLYPDSARDPAGDLWRYLVTIGLFFIHYFNYNLFILFFIIVTHNGLSCQVTWQVMWPPHGHSHPRPGHVPGHVPSHVMSHVPGYVSAPLTMGTHQGPLALGHSRRPSGTHGRSFPLARGHSFLVANTLHQLWLMAAFVSRRPSALAGLWLTAASGP